MSPTIAAARQLTELVHAARAAAIRSRAAGRPDLARRHEITATQLDAARTRLVQEGSDYIVTAWATIDAARALIASRRRARA